MKDKKALMLGGLALAGFLLAPAVLPGAAHAAEGSLTQSVKDTYQEAKEDLKELVDEITGDVKHDEQTFRARYEKDLKTYRAKVEELRQDYLTKRQEAQEAYLKKHEKLPVEEDIQVDLIVIPEKK